MQNNFIKEYRAKLPYIVLMFIIGLNADYVYFGEFGLLQIIEGLLLANFVILVPDYFCLTKKQDEYSIANSLLSYAVVTGLLSISLIITQQLRLTHLNIYGFCSIIVFFFLFPFIVDRSRYTDTL